MKRIVIITVMSEDERLSCSERFEWETKNYLSIELAQQAAARANRRITLLEARGPWKNEPKSK